MSNDEKAINKLIEYLRIKSVHPEPDYDTAVKFLSNYAKEVGFDKYDEIKVASDRTVVVMTYLGTEPEKSTILLNSHTDVVPVDQSKWKYDAFGAVREENGDIYGRGIQDMKSVGIQHIELIRRMKENNTRPKRTIHVSFVPDEEIGGVRGMRLFIETDYFKSLNVGCALDEGLASEDDIFSVFYGERIPWWIVVVCRGNTGHGSRFIEKTAVEKLQRLMNLVLAYREEQKARYKDKAACLNLGDVNTINLTQLSGGLAHNIVPNEVCATFDIRITPHNTIKEFEALFAKWVEEAEGDDKDSGRITYNLQVEQI
jgi:aminoacylase